MLPAVLYAVFRFVVLQDMHKNHVASHTLHTLATLVVSKSSSTHCDQQQSRQADADYELFPENWIFDKRWSKGAAVKDSEGRRIEFIEVGGRVCLYW